MKQYDTLTGSEFPTSQSPGVKPRPLARLCALIFVLALALAGAARAQVLLDLGSTIPTIGPNDISQTNAAATTGVAPDGLNYYFDNATPPGQTFVTGTNSYGYYINSVGLKLNGNSGGTLGANPYYLRVYSVSGTTATLITNIGSGTNFSFAANTDWLLFSNLSVKVVPTAVYAYTFSRLPASGGYCNLSSVSNNPYAGGQVCLIPTNGGSITYGASGNFDATFTVGLTPIIGTNIVAVSNWVYDTANYTPGNTNADIAIIGNGTSVVTITNTNSADSSGHINQGFFHSSLSVVGLTNVGDSVTLSGTVTLVGSGVSGNQQFRIGMFQQGTNTSDTNWLGYFEANANVATSGNANFDVRNNPNSGVYASGTGATVLANPAVTGGASYGAGTYNALISVTLLSGGMEALHWTFSNTVYQQFGSITNTNTATSPLTFDSVGILAGSSYGGSAIVFSNLAVTYSLPPPGININPEPVSEIVALGQPASFNVSVTGASPSYQWYTCSDLSYDNPQPIIGATNNVYAIASTVATNATNYFVVVTNSSSSATSTIATLTVRLTVNSLAWLGITSSTWDTVTANWSNIVSTTTQDYVPGDNVSFFDDGSSSNVLLSGTLMPSSISVASASNYFFRGTGSLAGGMTLTKSGTGTLVMSNANSFTGTVNVNNGTIQLANVAALGASTAVVNVNGGMVDIHSVQAPATAQFVIQGPGFTNGTNSGCIQNLGTSASQNGNGIGGLSLAGDATIGASGARWDLNGDATGGTKLQGNHHNLTKLGNQQIWLVDGGTNNGLNNVIIAGSTLGFQGVIDLGDPSGTITVLSNATLGFYNVPTNIVMNKNLVLSNGFIGDSISNITLQGPVTLMGTNNQGNPSSTNILTFNGVMSGSGGWVDAAAGSVVFNASNTYTGPTFVNSGTLTLGTGGSLASSNIQVAGLAILNASAATRGLTLGAGQTLLGGNGTSAASVLGNITNGPGSTIGAGIGGPGLFTVGTLTLNNATNIVYLGATPSDTTGGVNSYLLDDGNLTLTGVSTFVIIPNAVLSTNSPYLIGECDGTITGGLSNLHAVTTNPRLSASIVNPSTTVPFLEVNISGAAGQLLWKGGVAGSYDTWNHAITNWFNTVSSALDLFYDGDVVTFDDTAHTNTVNMTEAVAPATLTFNNNSLNYTLYGAGALTSSALNLNGTASVTIANSNTANIATINFNNFGGGSLIFNQPFNTAFGGALGDLGAGVSSVIKTGTNTLILSGNNTAYYGTIMVTNGVVQYTTNTALGGGSTYFIVTNSGSLDLSNLDAGTAKTIAISGAGYNGQGALMDSLTASPAAPYEIVHQLVLTSDATIGSLGRWDVASNGFITGNGFTLTKVGTGSDWLKPTGDIGVGNIHVVAGTLGFQAGVTMGVSNATITVESNATFGLWALANNLSKVAVFNGGAIFSSGGASNGFVGPITLNGTNLINFAIAADLAVFNGISGTNGIIKSGASNLWLYGTNTYTGPTTIGSNSKIVVGANSSLGASSTVEVDGGSTLDVSAPAALNFGTGQSLIGNGTVIGGTVNFNSGSRLAVGFSGSTSTMTMNGTLNLNAGSTNLVTINKGTTNVVPSDQIIGLTSVQMGGTLVITNIGSALANGDAIKLFTATNYSGSFSSIIPAAPGGAGYSWNTSTLDTDGTLRVIGPTIPTTPTNILFGLTNGQLTLSWPSPYTGWSLQAQTDTVGTGIGTNWFTIPGSSNTNVLTFTVSPTNGMVFYRMLLQQ